MNRKLYYSIFLCFSLLLAGDTGKIVGKVTDSETGETLVGVNILLKGTSMGAASDADGNYIILNVQAASYTITASFIGYKTINVTDARVNADLTTIVNFAMEVSAVEGEEVIVEAKRPPIVRDQTATTTTVEDDDIVNMPRRWQVLLKITMRMVESIYAEVVRERYLTSLMDFLLKMLFMVE